MCRLRKEAPDGTDVTDTRILDAQLQNYVKINFCCLSSSVTGTLFHQPWFLMCPEERGLVNSGKTGGRAENGKAKGEGDG